MSEQFDVYQPAERNIYRYTDGKIMVSADPMTLWQRLMEVRGDLTADLAVAFSPSEAAPKAYASLAAKSRKIFQVLPFEEGGLTQPECVNLLNHFWHYCDLIKKNKSNSQTSPTGTPGTPDTSSTES